jgi:hypothetical protein
MVADIVRWFILLVVALVGAGSGACACPPPVMLWAWERPDDLSGIDTSIAGVAYLAKTLVLTQDGVDVRNRRQPLAVPGGAYLMPVVRIETSPVSQPLLSVEQSRSLAAESLALARSGVPALQIDYDAPWSQRSFYADLLSRIRAELPKDVWLSMTALASWTLFDRWIDGLPVDEAVPMLFRMGADRDNVRRHLRTGGDVRATIARRALGLSTDEPLPPLPSGRRVYVFHPARWTPAAARNAIAEVTSWQSVVSCPSS